jgi:hypothetical protein
MPTRRNGSRRLPRPSIGRSLFLGWGRWLAVGALCLIGLLYYRPIAAYRSTGDELRLRGSEVRTLRAQKLALEQKLSLAESGATLLRKARRLGLVKPGERLFIVQGISEWRQAEAARRGR